MTEIWKEIPNFSRYQISNFGNVKSKAYQKTDSIGRIMNYSEKLLSVKPWINPKTNKPFYIKVKLLDDDDVVHNVQVHRLVATAFIPNPDNKPEVNHIDNDKSNNNATNLEWVTKAENMAKAIVPGHKGASNGNSKMTEDDVRHICKMIKNGYSDAEILKTLNLATTIENLSFIRHRKHWAWMPEVQNLPDTKSKRHK